MDTEKLGDFALNSIYNVDAWNSLKCLPDASIDVIMCDPVYYDLDAYKTLAEHAARLLKPTGFVLAQVGELFWAPAQEAFRQEAGLKHLPPIIEVYYFSTKAFQVGPIRISSGYTPWLFAAKELHKISVMNRYFGKRDKRFHKWGDGTAFAQKYIEVLCPPDGIVLDPFAGGGTVSVAATLAGRKHLAFEIDEEAYGRAVARLESIDVSQQEKTIEELLQEIA